jgi:hypothetical protein
LVNFKTGRCSASSCRRCWCPTRQLS